MSACSASRTALALALGALLAASPALARVIVNGTVLSDSGARRGNHHHARGADVTMDPSDTLGHGAIVVDDDSGGMVRFLADARVRPGEHFDGDVVAIFGNVTIEGDVTGSAVAVFGHVVVAPKAGVDGDAVAVLGSSHVGGHVGGAAVAVLGSLGLEPGASVGGDAVAVGGRVQDASLAHIGGESVSVGLLPLTFGLPALPAVLMAIVLCWLTSIFFGWLFALLFPMRLARVGVTASRRTFLSIVFAVLSLLLWPVAACLIMATIIGLPIGLMLFVVYPILVYAGQLGATYVLGCKLLRRRLGEGSTFGPIVAGSGLIAALLAVAAISYSFGGAGGAVALFFGLVAALVLLGLTTIGTGAFLLSRAGTLPRDVEPSPAGVHATGADSGPVVTA
jgi:hypothetical protein